MREIYIPDVIHQGSQENRIRLLVIITLIVAILLHLGFFYVMSLSGHNLLVFLFPEKTPPENHKSLQFVVVDEDLIDEKVLPDEKPKMRGRINRKSRDTGKTDPKLAKVGPSGKSNRNFEAFKEGGPSIADRSTPSPAPAPAPQKPSKAVKPRKPSKQRPKSEPQPITKTANPQPPVKKPEEVEKKPKPTPKKEKKTEELPLPDLEEKKFTGDFPPVPKLDAEKLLKEAREKPITKTAKPVEPRKETKPEPKPQKPKPKSEPSISELPLPPAVPHKRIPVKRIGSGQPRSRGSKMAARNSNAAMRAGIKSMAVLRDRYGAYMDIVLRRIQEAINIQQQISPMLFNQGTVVMTFRIDDNGELGSIKYVDAEPKNMPQEVAAARRVLEDVKSKPLPRPPKAMLNDPDFKKITINFVFVPR